VSKKHPIIAVTGSSGAGTMPVKVAFNHVFYRLKVNPVIVDGDSFHRYDRYEMREAVKAAHAKGQGLSHFGPKANLFDQLDALFREYGEAGTGRRRFYLHTEELAGFYGQKPGTFTPWEQIPNDTDLLFYQGLHGGLVTDEVDIAQHVDLLIGVVPIVNLEWIQKIHRDTAERGYESEDVTEIILRRLSDYVHYITPQFSRTDINFQRVPTVDTSNPFAANDLPTLDESFIVIRFADPTKFAIDFSSLLDDLKGSFMSRRNTIVVPGGKLELAMEILLTPIVEGIMRQGRTIL
jgi:phosphoribulokinase